MSSNSFIHKVHGWGRFPVVSGELFTPRNDLELLTALDTKSRVIPRGNGRSYGDCSLNPQGMISTTKLNHMLDWDEQKGLLTAESGVLLRDIIENFLPRGWFPFVTPGTKFVSLGGCIASDVHGKNHHIEGSFGDYVQWLDLATENGVVRCSPSENEGLFKETIGGMGLTGVILRSCIRLRKVETGWIKQKVVINRNLFETLSSFDDYQDSTYSVAWIDCLSTGGGFGRSVLLLGEHCETSDLEQGEAVFPRQRHHRFTVPLEPPSWLLNNVFVSLFNQYYFYKHKNLSTTKQSWDSFFYPLDSVGKWNKLYGKDGFFQFQSVLPVECSLDGYTEMLNVIQQSASGSFLAVIKRFGAGRGGLSFPMEGFTLAVDFKANPANIDAVKSLTEVVNTYNGRIYLAKDALMTAGEFHEQIKHQKFGSHRDNRMSSMQSERLQL